MRLQSGLNKIVTGDMVGNDVGICAEGCLD